MDPKNPKFVVFFSEACPECQSMHQAWINLSDKLKNKVNVMAVSRDYNHDAIRSLGVYQYPTIRLYKGPNARDYVEYPANDEGTNLKE